MYNHQKAASVNNCVSGNFSFSESNSITPVGDPSDRVRFDFMFEGVFANRSVDEVEVPFSSVSQSDEMDSNFVDFPNP